ncbi:hypothetical protein CXB51_024572 [Gossypium anomalum]|uniref:DUF7745 domain-containing protein n=1 Tax=Gossypium anomalum TaxID=47600 RepID=A0A8J6CR75_9ROSI|nr:hypothetical protein CXB51_024572 [Gossypium anomalum]
MENEFLNKVEDNAAVRAWSEKLQSEKGDSLTEGYTSELQEFTRVNAAQNELQELRDIWARWDEETKKLFYQSYGDISYLLDIKNSAYKCFTFGEVDLVPTIEEYTALLRCPKVQVRKAYAKVFNGQTFTKKLMNISGMSEPWVTARIQQKGDSKSLRHVDEAVTDLFDRLEKGITPVPAILAETFRSLSMYRKLGDGRFIGCAQLLMTWFHGYFWKCEFSFKGAHYKKKVRELSDAWKQTHWMKRLAVGSIMTPEYNGWFKKRVNDNVPRPSLENTQPMRSEAEKWEKGKTKAEKDLDSLKTDYKKLRLSMRTAGLGKTFEQWRHEIREEKTKADRWERKFREAQVQNEDLGKSLLKSRNEQDELKARVAELEKSLHQY